MTNRELLQKAMPLSTLSQSQWDMLNKHIEQVEQSDFLLFSALSKLIQNQSRMEIISNYQDYYSDKMDSKLSEVSTEINI